MFEFIQNWLGAPKFCPDLLENLPVYDQNGNEIGAILKQPMTSQAEDPKSLSSEDAPVFLKPIHPLRDEFCAYPLDIQDKIAFSEKNLWSEMFRDYQPKGIGVPTELYLDPQRQYYGYLRLNKDQPFLLPDFVGMRWYVLGPQDHFLEYAQKVKNGIQALDALLQSNAEELLQPRFLENSLDWLFDHASTQTSAYHKLVQDFTEKLLMPALDDIQTQHPDLYDKISPGLNMGSMDLVQANYSNSIAQAAASYDLNVDAMAYAIPDTLEIKLCGALIPFLERPSDVAAILAHEFAHIANARAGLVEPTSDLTSHIAYQATVLYFDRQGYSDFLLGPWLVNLWSLRLSYLLGNILPYEEQAAMAVEARFCQRENVHCSDKLIESGKDYHRYSESIIATQALGLSWFGEEYLAASRHAQKTIGLAEK